ncbi:carbohydrate ABC transporter permease [Bifidobacterium sp. W8115]|uniref:Carbohydrate ABC transporter permease n=1 Tax=Bifidobacterium apousia TaxID=2750996 RepID=A0A556R4V0_9BIFI|nr:MULTISPECIES: carbohydrate ABC transporter permease [Bifidobacterium]MBI0061962.1 carbohydrate ABC transporter permease [Bifidobacterium apousia]MBI0071632.1 carbohydrate ABC transporter permease [Bifidobacterium sp. W8112]MBI0124627.1 carbohydrate ABC transporter permease [Bifidobacterium apousia]MBI0137455.1 carbohydrate ABC transporter permease [Bifidobacterium sp. W8120]TSJ83913.1 carbohydrate ABC transporter permease [Bifidobacterium apousia]
MTSATYTPDTATQAQSSTTVNKRSKTGTIVHAVLVVLVMLVLLGVPFWLLIVTAGKSQAEAIRPTMSLPSHWQLLQNFSTVITDGKMIKAFFGSVIVTVPSVFLALLLGSMASWVLARRATKPMTVVYALSISGLVLPPAVVTVMMLLKIIGLSGTALGMIGVYVGIYLSTVIFFVTGFIRTIPISLEEAARMDGASPMRIFFTIILPLLGPTLATATILVTLYIWNDVFYSLFILSGKMDLLPLNLYNIASAGLYLNNWHLIFAYIILMSLPLLIIFALAQRKIISGITGGAVK